MAIQDIKNAVILKEYCSKIGREGMGDEILALAKEIVELGEAGQYVLLMKKAGEIKAITVGANTDCYFSEKVHHGFYDRLHKAEQFNKSNTQ